MSFALFALVFSMPAHAFDFSSVCGTGQTLYYDILTDSTAEIVFPNHAGTSYYSGYTLPSGNIQLPSVVTNGGVAYYVVAIGSNAFTGCSGITSVAIPNTVTSIGSSAFAQCSGLHNISIPNSVTAIGDNAFMGCSQLLSVTVPDAVTMIGVGTFQGCSALTSVTIGSSVSTIGNVAFEGCSSLTSLFIPDGVTIIGNWAFCNCTGLDSIYIGNSVSYIYNNTFAGVSSVRYIHYNARNANCSYYSGGAYYSALPVGALTKLIIGDSVQSLPQYSFANASLLDTVVLGSSVSTIDANAFASTSNVHYLYYNTGLFTNATFPSSAFSAWTGLTQLVIGNNVQHIPNRAFASKPALQHVTFPSTVISIGDSAFSGCTSLQGPLQLPSMLTAIGDYAFQGCSSISGSLVLPVSLLSIGTAAFAGCSSISGTLTIPSGIQSVGPEAFYDCDSILALTTQGSVPIPSRAFMGCNRLFSVTLDVATPSIGGAAFSNCERLTELYMGNALTSIGNSAFSGCVRLVNPLLPPSLVTIGDSSFFGCTLMGNSLAFPATITSIGNYAYASIAPVTMIEMRGSLPPTIYDSTFASASNSTPVFVPCAATVNYLVSDYWEDFSNILESAPFAIALQVNDASRGYAVVLQEPTCSNFQAGIQAVPDSGFHFLRWNDGITVNPRQLILSSDTSFTAFFVPDNSYIQVTVNDSTRGVVSGAGSYNYNDTAVLYAIANLNYHFQRWSDGDSQNPRQVIVTQDSHFVAIFLSDTATLTVSSADTSRGIVSGGGIYYYQDQAIISAIPAYGYHFSSWNDGSNVNPRTVTISQDTVFVASFDANNYTVSVSSNNSSMGSANGSGSYTYLSTATLSATPVQGYHFVQWSDGSTVNPRMLMVVSDTTLTAQFAPNEYQLTVVANDSTMGVAHGSGFYDYNTTVLIYATASEGFHFIQWNDGNSDNPRTVLVTDNTTYTAQFAVNIYSIMVSSANPTMGSVTGGGSYSHNTSVTISATPATGCHFTQWNDGNTDNPRTILATQNASYIAQFAINTYSLTLSVNNSSLGSVSGGGSYSYNSTVTIAATPNYGFHFVQWNDGSTLNPRTITITQDLSFTAQFDTNQYTVTALSSNVSGGNVVGGGTYNYLSQAVLTAYPQSHYHFTQWNDSLTNNPRSIIVLSDTQLVAHFQIDSHTVAVASANSTMGHTSGNTIVAYGDAIYISATANYGYRFISWSDGVSLNPRRVIVASDTSFTALFTSNNYVASITSNDTTLGVVAGGGTYPYLTSLTLTATPFGGSRFARWSDGVTDNPRLLTLTRDTALQALFVVNTCRLDCAPSDSTMGMVSGSGTYNYGSQIAILATAFANHHFVQWNDGVTSNPRLVTLTGDTLLVALFEQEALYTLTVASNNDELGTASGSGQYHYGDEVHLSAIASPHCHFIYWSDGNTTNPRAVHVIADASYLAVFGVDMFTVDLSVNNPDLGAVYGEGEYPYGSQASITAIPFPGAMFRSWSDGNTDNPRSLYMTGNIVLQALFDSQLGISDVSQEDASPIIFVQGKELHVIGADNHVISVYDIYGRKVTNDTDIAIGEYITVLPSAGIYIVCPGNGKPQKIVAF